MLILLQLTTLSRLAYYILLTMYGEGIVTNDPLRHCLEITFGTTGGYLFLELAIIMNIAKWFYYF